jgi:hypothetical protein
MARGAGLGDGSSVHGPNVGRSFSPVSAQTREQGQQRGPIHLRVFPATRGGSLRFPKDAPRAIPVEPRGPAAGEPRRNRLPFATLLLPPSSSRGFAWMKPSRDEPDVFEPLMRRLWNADPILLT